MILHVPYITVHQRAMNDFNNYACTVRMYRYSKFFDIILCVYACTLLLNCRMFCMLLFCFSVVTKGYNNKRPYVVCCEISCHRQYASYSMVVLTFL